ncbi:hypothetical protein Tco_1507052 [Tanacetum coccineum]
MANEQTDVRDGIISQLNIELEKEVMLGNNLLGEMTRYLQQMCTRAEEEKKVHSMPLDQKLNIYGLHTLLMTSKSDRRVTSALKEARRFKECPMRKCGFHGFINDELPSQYYKELLFQQYDEFPAPSSDDDLPATFNERELQYNNVGEIEVSKMLIGMIEEELSLLKSKTKFHDLILLVLPIVFVLILIVFAKIMSV